MTFWTLLPAIPVTDLWAELLTMNEHHRPALPALGQHYKEEMLRRTEDNSEILPVRAPIG